MENPTFQTLAGPGTAEIRVRGSTFRALAAPVCNEADARDVLAERQRLFFDATHNCSAWSLRDGTRRGNDAGEPSGSAGAPILAAIDGAELVDCIVVVTRYFGGTKLGVGGLVRAYAKVAAIALAEAPRRRGIPAVRLCVRYPYGHTAPVMRVLEQPDIYDIAHGFAPGGDAGEVTFSLPRAMESRVREALRDATAGDVIPEVVEEHIVYRDATV
ncbi:hypothetical protein BH23GEM3_BH23GEM3_01100 [soil metagenome]